MMNLPSDAAFKIYDMVKTLHRHETLISSDEGFAELSYDMVDKIIRYFNAEKAVRSVTFDAKIRIEGTDYDGFVDIHREGQLVMRLAH